MSAIRTGIELQDNFTSVLYQVIDSVNLGLAAMEDLHQTMNSPVDMTSIEGARDSINRATIAVQELDAAMQGIETPANEIPAISENSVTVDVPVNPIVPNPLIDSPPPAIVPVEWQSYNGIEVFANTGAERFEREIADINSMLERLGDTQSEILQQANEAEILSPEALNDIQNVENRISELHETINQIENNPMNIETDTANVQLERLREQLNETLQLQANLNQAMQGMDITEINDAYLRLSQNVSGTERLVRDSFARLPPIEVPVEWKTETLQVFTNTGIERFRQEVQSANLMLERLSGTQEAIARRAYDTNIFPSEAFQNLNAMSVRIDAVRSRIQQIENNPLNMGTNAANAQLEQLRSQLDGAVAEQRNLNSAIENMDVQSANEAYLRLSQIISGTERHIRDNVDEQGRFTREIERSADEANDLMQTIKGAAAAYATIQTLGSVIELSDTMTQTAARLDLIVDDGSSVEELQNKIFLSAERSRGSYLATADAVARLGAQASQAFTSNDELIEFTEQLNKQFVIAGTSAQGIDSVMLQLTQSMASGRLQGEELNAVLDSAQPIVAGIQRYLEEVQGIDASNIKELASEGVITAEIIKNAMFYIADETNAKFESMPMTFAQVWASFQNNALIAFQPVLRRINEIANSKAFQNFVNNAVEAVSMVADIVLDIFDLLIEVGSIIADNWSWISPVIYGAAAALAVYYGWLLLTKGAELALKGVQEAVIFGKLMMAAATWTLTSATWAEAAAVWGLDAALYACPIVWIIILIIALIAVIYAACEAISNFTDDADTGLGVLMGCLNVVRVCFKNLEEEIENFALGVWNVLCALCNNIDIAFDNVINNVQGYFYLLLSTALDVVSEIAEALNKLPFIEFDYSGLAGAADEYAAKAAVEFKANTKEYEDISAAFDRGMNTFEGFQDGWASKAFQEGAEWGDSVINSLFGPSAADAALRVNNSASDVLRELELEKTRDYLNGLNELNGIGNEIAENTGDIADSMELTEEDLKYLRDMAEMETVNRFTTAEINIDMSGMNNTIKNGDDLDGFVSGLTDAVYEAVDIMAEGVHS